MGPTQRRAGLATSTVIAAAAMLWMPSHAVQAASATALVSATVLGPAETEIASGAVTVSELSEREVSTFEPSPSRRLEAHNDIRGLAAFRVGGGFHAAYAVTLPETVAVQGQTGELKVSAFRVNAGTGRLAADGTGMFVVGASVSIPPQQAAGAYSGKYPVTVAYN